MNKNDTNSYSFAPNLLTILQQNNEIRTIENTDVETDQMSTTYFGSNIIKSNYLKVGSSIFLQTNGVLSTFNAQTATQKLKIGGNDIIVSSGFALPNGLTTINVELNLVVKILTIGSTGTCVVCGGSKIYDPASTKYRQLTQSTPQLINTTIDNTIQLTYRFEAINASNILKIFNFTIRY
jgi:hypothetical protein